MIKVHVIQARYGDCLLLEYGEADRPSFMLIDGGPARNYKERLKPALASLLNGQTVIGDIVISHVDNDHILGVLDMLTEWLIEKDTGGAASLTASHCWFNSFSNTIRTRQLETRLAAINKVASLQGVQMLAMNFTLTGIQEGGLRGNDTGIQCSRHGEHFEHRARFIGGGYRTVVISGIIEQLADIPVFIGIEAGGGCHG